LSVLALAIWGGEVIRGFSIAMIWGIVIGTYSTICVATPLLLYMHLHRIRGKDEKAADKTTGKAGAEKKPASGTVARRGT
jgi:preprotein translocase subunit SecF